MNIKTTKALNNGTSIPVLGFGTWRMLGEEAYTAVRAALDAGYRHIDTAQLYQNEVEVGRAVRDSGIDRSEIYVTSKLQIAEFGADSANVALDESLKKLDIDYLDLFLLHWPVANLYVNTWNSLVEAHDSDKCRSFGVSNFAEDHIEDLLANSEYVPVVNQVELHPLLRQKELQDYCESKGVLLEAYSPLAQGKALNDGRLVEIASQYGKSTAQVMIRWSLQNGLIVLPKSKSEGHIRSNGDVSDFEITPDDMENIDAMNIDKHYSWNPNSSLFRKVVGTKIVRMLTRR